VSEKGRTQRMQALARKVVDSYDRIGGINRIGDKTLPSQAAIVDVLQQLLTLVFPGYYGGGIPARANMEVLVASRVDALFLQLSDVINQTLHFCHHEPCQCSVIWSADGNGSTAADFSQVSEAIAMDYLDRLPDIRNTLKTDVEAAYEGDPAAVNRDEVILCYPGTFAIAVYRLAHPLYRLGVPLVPRIMTEWAHHRTGVDIHPGARIGTHFFIDHGTGVVIGETTEIGTRVKLYQGVTLGALSFPRNPDGTLVKGGKRHPTIEDEVTVYANATILGGKTVIGRGAVIGGGTWLTKSVPPGAKVLSNDSV
jgi:serine O-acetyltransferase